VRAAAAGDERRRARSAAPYLQRAQLRQREHATLSVLPQVIHAVGERFNASEYDGALLGKQNSWFVLRI